MGARVRGAGTGFVHIEGADELSPFDHAIISDRIEAGTYMVAAAAAGGDVLVERVPVEDLEALLAKLRAAGVTVEPDGRGVRIVRRARAAQPSISPRHPHPGFPTDMQAQFMVLMCVSRGTARIMRDDLREPLHARARAGAHGRQRRVHGNTAFVTGPTPLSGATVMATDLRASASLVIAGLVGRGRDRRPPRLPPRSRLRAHRAEARAASAPTFSASATLEGMP